jgi:hypothetical protein
MSAQSQYYSTGGGELFFTPITGGAYGTEEAFGQTENVNFSTEIETLTHDNTESSVMLEDLNILKKVTGTLNIETVEISPSMLAKAYLGNDNTTAVSADTAITGITGVSLDVEYMLDVKHVTLSTVTASTTGALASDDYTLRVENNVTYITFVNSGTNLGAFSGEDITFTGTNPAYDDINVEGFLQSKIEGKLRFVSKPANGVAYEYTFYRVSLTASGDFALKSAEELSKLSFAGQMLASEIDGDGSATSKLFKIEGTELTA